MAVTVPMRPAYGEALVALGNANPNVVALSADVSNSDFSYRFAEAFPERFVNVGIAEQCLVDVAVGLAYSGKIPFANTFAFLFATRALEMVRTHLCYGNANVKLMAAYAGLSDSFDGPTHNSISDVAIMRSLPNMTVVVPGDTVALAKLLPQVADWPGPVYFRMNRNEVPLIFDERYSPVIGRAVALRPGHDVTIICNGLMVSRSLEAADLLAGEGIDAAVLEMHTVKPLDTEAIIAAAEGHRRAGHRRGAQHRRRAGRRGGRDDQRRLSGPAQTSRDSRSLHRNRPVPCDPGSLRPVGSARGGCSQSCGGVEEIKLYSTLAVSDPTQTGKDSPCSSATAPFCTTTGWKNRQTSGRRMAGSRPSPKTCAPSRVNKSWTPRAATCCPA